MQPYTSGMVWMMVKSIMLWFSQVIGGAGQMPGQGGLAQQNDYEGEH